MGELKMTDPIKLLAHRRYYLVVKMGGWPAGWGREEATFTADGEGRS